MLTIFCVGTPPRRGSAVCRLTVANPTISWYDFMSLIARLFVILLGFLAASLVAGAIVVGAVLFPALSDFATARSIPAR